MTTDNNPYAPPRSKLRAAGDTRMYSPLQAGLAAFFGGPLAATYVLRNNFLALEHAERAGRTLTYGLLLSLLVVLVLPFIPDGVPDVASSVIYAVVTGQVVGKYQLSKVQISESDRYTFQSNWRVFAVIILAALLLIAVAVPYILALEAVGVG